MKVNTCCEPDPADGLTDTFVGGISPPGGAKLIVPPSAARVLLVSSELADGVEVVDLGEESVGAGGQRGGDGDGDVVAGGAVGGAGGEAGVAAGSGAGRVAEVEDAVGREVESQIEGAGGGGLVLDGGRDVDRVTDGPSGPGRSARPQSGRVGELVPRRR